MDGSTKPPQISEMFQKFALAFKTKTFDFFADDTSADDEDSTLLDPSDEFITNQKVVVIKPDHAFHPIPLPPTSTSELPTQKGHVHYAQIAETLISSLFATISSLRASYLVLQTAHAPFDEEGIKAADGAIISQLQKLSDIKRSYKNSKATGAYWNANSPIGSCLESQVQENQSMLRTLETVVNLLQLEIESKDADVLSLKQNLDKLLKSNKELSTKLDGNTSINSPTDILLSVGVFDSVLRNACSSVYKFTKLLILLMKKAGWDLNMAAKSLHSDIDFTEGHSKYALLSYVCLGMFQGFDSEDFGVGGSNDMNSLIKNESMRKLVEHLSYGPMEALNRNPDSDFSNFCDKKYKLIIDYGMMESSVFGNFDRKEDDLWSWKSQDVFHEAFINMASWIWILHKLAFSFEPVVRIFQVERGTEFSIVHMEDATRKFFPQGKTKPKVGFTIVPGFKIRNTVIQARVYLS